MQKKEGVLLRVDFCLCYKETRTVEVVNNGDAVEPGC